MMNGRHACLLVGLIGISWALENGLARRPPMGWLSWSTFWCHTDCQANPSTCVSQENMAAMADRIAQDGYKDAGYKLVALDDCWFHQQRDARGRLQPHPQRFSKGIKWLADYVHEQGLLFGIYEDIGVKTCAGYPGTYEHEEMDAETFGSWGVDYVKLDGCFVNGTDMDAGYVKFRDALNKTRLPIVYSCEWPLYTQDYDHKKPNYTAVKETCNLWRNWHDVALSWESVLSIIDYYDEHQDELIAVNGPGGWNDPDMLIIGNNDSLTEDQAKVQMAIWSIWSAPLIMSVDLRTIREPFKKILQNKHAIAIDQDPMGKMGRLVHKRFDISVYVKPITPTAGNETSYALAFMNRGQNLDTFIVPFISTLGLLNPNGYEFKNVFDDSEPGKKLKPNEGLNVIIKPTGVTMFKATIIL